MHPSRVEPSRRRAVRASTSTIRVPIAALVARHPKELSTPNSAMPAAIIHLPTGGCTG